MYLITKVVSPVCILFMININGGAQMPPSLSLQYSNSKQKQNKNVNPNDSNQDQSKNFSLIDPKEKVEGSSAPPRPDSRNPIGMREGVIILSVLSLIAISIFGIHCLRQSKYHIFICYKRDASESLARLIYTVLQSKGLNVFLDVDDLRSGCFNQALLNTIAETPNVIVILSPNCFDFYSGSEDFFQKEIIQAVKTNRNIIPIFMPGFEFRKLDKLPKEIRALRMRHGVSYSHEFFNAMINRIVTYLKK